MSLHHRRQMLVARQASVLERALFPDTVAVNVRAVSTVASTAKFEDATYGDSVAATESYLAYRRWQEARMRAVLGHAQRTDITFAKVLEHRAALVRENKLSSAAFANERTALARYRECFGLTEHDSVVPRMTHQFAASLAEFERTAVGSGINGSRLSSKSVPGYLSRLRTLQATALSLLEVSGTFAETLNRILNTWKAEVPGRTLQKLAKRSEVPLTMIQGWRRGSRPDDRNFANVKMLESAIGVPSGTLSDKVAGKDSLTLRRNIEQKLERFRDDAVTPAASRIKYIPRFQELSPSLKGFFAKLEEYKTGSSPGVNFAGQRLRRLNRVRKGKGDISLWSTNFRRFMFGMVGWLTLPNTEDGAKQHLREHTTGHPLTDRQIENLAPVYVGQGLRGEEITPCHLVDPEFVGRYLDWKTARSTESGYHRTFVKQALSLIRRGEGFLAQQPEYSWEYLGTTPIRKSDPDWKEKYVATMRAWSEVCDDYFAGLREISSNLSRHSKARDPRVDLRPILNEPDPMRPLIEIIRFHESLRPLATLAPGSPRQTALALWFRDQLLLRLIVSNPLRAKNLADMTWIANNQGNLYRDGDGWRIRFRPDAFKNAKGAARDAYDVAVSPALTGLTAKYIDEARPILLGQNCSDAVFVSSRGGRSFDGEGISNLLDDLTRGYLKKQFPTVKSLRSHAFRHIVATRLAPS